MSVLENKKSLVINEHLALKITPDVFDSLLQLYKGFVRLLQKDGKVWIVGEPR